MGLGVQRDRLRSPGVAAARLARGVSCRVGAVPRCGAWKRKGRDYDEQMAYLTGSGYSEAEALARIHCPDGPRYSALGNGWPVPIVRWIGERIEAVHAMTGGPLLAQGGKP